MQSAHFLFSLQIQNKEDTVVSLGQSDLEVNVILLWGERMPCLYQPKASSPLSAFARLYVLGGLSGPWTFFSLAFVSLGLSTLDDRRQSSRQVLGVVFAPLTDPRSSGDLPTPVGILGILATCSCWSFSLAISSSWSVSPADVSLHTSALFSNSLVVSHPGLIQAAQGPSPGVASHSLRMVYLH